MRDAVNLKNVPGQNIVLGRGSEGDTLESLRISGQLSYSDWPVLLQEWSLICVSFRDLAL